MAHAATDSDPPTTPIFVSTKEAAHLLNLSPTQVKRLLQREELESTRIGRRRVIPVAAIHDFATKLQEQEG